MTNGPYVKQALHKWSSRPDCRHVSANPHHANPRGYPDENRLRARQSAESVSTVFHRELPLSLRSHQEVPTSATTSGLLLSTALTRSA